MSKKNSGSMEGDRSGSVTRCDKYSAVEKEMKARKYFRQKDWLRKPPVFCMQSQVLETYKSQKLPNRSNNKNEIRKTGLEIECIPDCLEIMDQAVRT